VRLRVVFFGTPAFAVPALEALAAQHEVCAVFTRPDAVSGRGKTLVPSPVRVAAEQLSIPVHAPRSLVAEEEGEAGVAGESPVATLVNAAPDIAVVAAYGLILPVSVLELPRLGCVNIHASLLPRWRGAAPLQRALLAGDEELGVCVMRMEKGLDTGPYCATAATPAGEKGLQQLTHELAVLGAQALVGALPAIADGTAAWVAQDERMATYAEKVQKSELVLQQSDTVDVNLRRVRASSPQAPARCVVEGRPVTVLEAGTCSLATTGPCRPRRLAFRCADGELEICMLKPDGKKAMSAEAFLAGLR
jgi:methionyl-tRNA formyltransferase